MIKFIKTFLISVIVWSAQASFVLAQTAALLPNAIQQYFDNNGNPLSSGSVGFYDPGTLTKKPIWRDSNQVTPWANPLILDAGGKPPSNGAAGIYGNGTYRQIVKDRNGNTVWDAVTASSGSGGGGSATGDGDLVGTIKPWAGLLAPNQYMFAYGEEISRATFSNLFIAITQSLSVTCASSSNTLSGVSDTTQIRIGEPLEVSCLTAGTTVVSKTSTTLIVSNPASISINTTAIFFPFGNGNGTTTFNLPDLRGNVIAGRTNMGGIVAQNLTSTYFGSNSNPDAQGAVGGFQTSTLTQQNLPNIAPNFIGQSTAVNVASTSANVITSNVNTGITSGSDHGAVYYNSNSGTVNSSGVFTPFGTISLLGNDTPFANIQPTMVLNYIIKVTPDANSATANGVTSLGGMTGSIACGVGLLCTGQTIGFGSSANNQILATNGIGTPGFTNTIPNGVIATTQSFSDNSTLLATTAFVQEHSAVQGITNVSGSSQTTTASCTASSTSVALGSAIDFTNGQGIILVGCGGATTATSPSTIQVIARGTTGSTTYSYKVQCYDQFGGMDVPSTAITITNGNSTLTNANFNAIYWNLTSNLGCIIYRQVGGSGAYTIAGFVGDQSIFADNGGGPGGIGAGLSYMVVNDNAPATFTASTIGGPSTSLNVTAVASGSLWVDNGNDEAYLGGLPTTGHGNVMTLSGAGISANTTLTTQATSVSGFGGTGHYTTNINSNATSATVTGTLYPGRTASCPGSGGGCSAGSWYTEILYPSNTVKPFWAPINPVSAGQNQWLVTTITAGGGTTTLTVANAPSTNTTSLFIGHDDTAALQTAITAASASLLKVPCGYYRISTTLTMPNVSGSQLVGSGMGCTTFDQARLNVALLQIQNAPNTRVESFNINNSNPKVFYDGGISNASYSEPGVDWNVGSIVVNASNNVTLDNISCYKTKSCISLWGGLRATSAMTNNGTQSSAGGTIPLITSDAIIGALTSAGSLVRLIDSVGNSYTVTEASYNSGTNTITWACACAVGLNTGIQINYAAGQEGTLNSNHPITWGASPSLNQYSVYSQFDDGNTVQNIYCNYSDVCALFDMETHISLFNMHGSNEERTKNPSSASTPHVIYGTDTGGLASNYDAYINNIYDHNADGHIVKYRGANGTISNVFADGLHYGFDVELITSPSLVSNVSLLNVGGNSFDQTRGPYTSGGVFDPAGLQIFDSSFVTVNSALVELGFSGKNFVPGECYEFVAINYPTNSNTLNNPSCQTNTGNNKSYGVYFSNNDPNGLSLAMNNNIVYKPTSINNGGATFISNYITKGTSNEIIMPSINDPVGASGNTATIDTGATNTVLITMPDMVTNLSITDNGTTSKISTGTTCSGSPTSSYKARNGLVTTC